MLSLADGHLMDYDCSSAGYLDLSPGLILNVGSSRYRVCLPGVSFLIDHRYPRMLLFSRAFQSLSTTVIFSATDFAAPPTSATSATKWRAPGQRLCPTPRGMVTLSVMHSLGGIPLVTMELYVGDALIELSGLDVEPVSD